MSFQPPSNKQELQNRKILEELQKKQQALKQPSTSNLSIKSVTPKSQINQTNFNQIDPSINNFQLNNPNLQTQNSNGHQREKALQYALQNSYGNYISQDSSFGNNFLPVLPYSF